jgi:hypothetical protein
MKIEANSRCGLQKLFRLEQIDHSPDSLQRRTEFINLYDASTLTPGGGRQRISAYLKSVAIEGL